jgi:hypothetical protein
MGTKKLSNEHRPDWVHVDPQKIESRAFQDLTMRIQQASSEQGQVTDPTNWRDSHWKQWREAKGPCYVTEACVQVAGLPDNCIELQTLRHFRDNYLLKNAQGRKLVKEYYQTAPAIVEELKRRGESKEIFHKIFKEIQQIVRLIQKEQFRLAATRYQDMVEGLKGKYL